MFSVVARRVFPKVVATTPKAFAFRAFSEKLTIPTDNEQQYGRRKEEMEAEAADDVGLDIEARMDKLKREIKFLAKAVYDIKQDRSFITYQACVHSLSVHHQLDTALHFSHNDLLSLRYAEDRENKFFFEEDEEVCDYKTYKALEMLRTMNEGCAQMFREMYRESFVSDVIDHFKDYDFSLVRNKDVYIHGADEYWRVIEKS